MASSADRTEGGYDVVHARDFRVLNAGVELSQKYNCPIVAAEHTVPAEYRIAIEGR
ncbi:glycosyltransferase family 4 protein [Arachnia propionica]|uniref:glycosyltransferase family 4 protein n=1 Tax=Arachnia propionica TaxID=1750 RepID=UPI0011D01F9A|nr:glycosyltransferase family 4 protein [Arachnia propionica]